MNSFFHKCEKKLPVSGDQDDFVLAMEGAPVSDAKLNCSIYEITAWKQDPEDGKTYPEVATLIDLKGVRKKKTVPTQELAKAWASKIETDIYSDGVIKVDVDGTVAELVTRYGFHFHSRFAGA